MISKVKSWDFLLFLVNILSFQIITGNPVEGQDFLSQWKYKSSRVLHGRLLWSNLKGEVTFCLYHPWVDIAVS